MLSIMPWLEIRVCMQKSKSTSSLTNTKTKMHENQTSPHTCTPRVTIHLLPSKMGHGMHVGYFGKTKTKQKIIVPRWRYLSCLNKNDQVPQENCQKYLTLLLSWSIRWPAPVPFNILTQGCSPNTMVKQQC